MQQLHLVGFTTDHRGLIFSARRGAKSGGYVVHLDASLVSALDELRRPAGGAGSPDAAGGQRPESALSVREVQSRLREGHTIEQVAREAGVEVSWVERFAVPVLAEQAEVIRSARAVCMTKQRVGESSAPLGEAVYRNLMDRGVTDPRDELDKAWRARRLSEGMWLITFRYDFRGKPMEAAWEYDTVDGSLRGRGRLAATLGFREGMRREPAASAPVHATKPSLPTKKPPAKPTSPSKQTTTKQTTAKKAAPQKSSTSSRRVAAARRAAEARMASEVERATRRHAAIAHKAAKKRVVVPAIVAEQQPEPEPEPVVDHDVLDAVTVDRGERELLLDEPAADEPKGWADDLDLFWDDATIAVDDTGVLRRASEAAPEAEIEGELEPESEVEVEAEVEIEVEAERELEAEPDVEVEPETEPEVEAETEIVEAEPEVVEAEPEVEPETEVVEPEPEVQPEPAPVVREVRMARAGPKPGSHPARREPLRARRPADAAEEAEDAERDEADADTSEPRVRLRVRPAPVDAPATNGPVFHSDLAQPAGELTPPRPRIGPSPTDPLSIPQPIEALPRRWRRRTVRRR